MQDTAIRFQLDLFRLDASARAVILPILNEMERELLGQLATGSLTEYGTLRTKQLLYQVRETVNTYYAKMQSELYATTQGVSEIAARAAQTALVNTSGGVVLGASLPTEAMLASIASNAIIQGAVQKDWWARQSADTAWRFGTAVRQGMAAGETNAQIITRVRSAIEISRANAAALVQTSVATVANNSRMETFKANEDVIKRYRFITALDQIVCPLCAAAADRTWKPGDDRMPNPPLHYNCLVGDSLVSATEDVTGTSKRWFDGEVIIIKTAAGRQLTCTPNHPILTGGGWIAAGLLDVGCNVISDSIGHWGAGSHSDHKNVPPAIHDFIESFLSSRQVGTMPVPVSSRDFHGDGMGSKVAVIYSESLLRDSIYAPILEHRSENGFIVGFQRDVSSFFGLGGRFKAGAFSWPTSKKIMTGCEKLKSFFGRHGSPSSELLLTSVPSGYSSFAKCSHHNHSSESHSFGNARDSNAGIKQFESLFHIDFDAPPSSRDSGLVDAPDNGIEAYAKLASDLLAGNAGSVFFDNVISIKRECFHGFVYNLETVKGWYIANGIITHNCRCLLVPEVFDGVQGGTRASEDGQVPTSTTFKEFLDRQSVGWQNETLGVGRAEMYRDGKITLKNLVDGSGRELTLTQLKAKYN
jgi:SPP1 gp7 family putative phage head morphogenesis protein